MANTATVASATPARQTIPRPRLAANVVCLFAEDRPPVVNRPRRGRLPKAVAVLSAARPLRIGALCEFSAEGHETMPVRIIERLDNGRFRVEAVAGHEFVFPNGARGRGASVHYSCLRRSAIIDLQYATIREN